MNSAETTAPHEHSGTVPRRRRTLRRVLISVGVLGLVMALVTGGALWFFTDRYAGNIDRVSGVSGVSGVSADLDAESRPAPATPAQEAGEQPVTFLLVGTDTRATAEEGIAAAAGPTQS